MTYDGKTVVTDAELFRCSLFRTPVTINMGDCSDHGIIVNQFDEDCLYVDGAFYIRSGIQVERTEIKTDADLYNCLLFQTSVEVRTAGIVNTYASTINAFNEEIVFADNEFFFRMLSEFYAA
ncbi:hypothetical protein [Cohnella sp. AR92]|uniref:hypothetical protein n=1 Tax=Cohnella sp. AR92 TaxID=648716 RepID=UPI000F8F3157|nr:hypothetical protein [Cohnella sp. AR92]RUS44999.1 hypothetical protein ELR57_22350 [Cohnella sp. AR92]